MRSEAAGDQIQVTGTRLSSPEISGEAKPLLLVGPSLGTSVEALWGPAVPFLQEEFDVVGWDLPGHGAAAPQPGPFRIEDLAEAVQRFSEAVMREAGSSRPVHFAGVSIGGAVVQQLAVSAEPGSGKIAVLCSAARIGTPEAWRERASFVERAGTPSMVEGSARRWFAPGFIESQPVAAAALLHSLQNADRHAYARCCEALAEFDLREALSTARVPVLAVAGAEDAVCPPAEARLIAERVPHGEHQVLPGVAHLAPAEAPRATAHLLKEFFLER